MFILIPLGVISLAGIIYMAISKKSDIKQRIAALVALGLMILTVVICLFQIFGTQKVTVYPLDMPMPVPNQPVTQDSSNGTVLIFIIFLLILFILVLILSIREHRLVTKEKNKIKIDSDWD